MVYTLSTTVPTVTEALTIDTGSSASDHITSNDALSGSGLANTVVHFTIDGSAIATTVTANAAGRLVVHPERACRRRPHHRGEPDRQLRQHRHRLAQLHARYHRTGGGDHAARVVRPTRRRRPSPARSTSPMPARPSPCSTAATALGSAGGAVQRQLEHPGHAEQWQQLADRPGHRSPPATPPPASAVVYTLSTTAPTLTEALTIDTGSSASDHITSNDALSGSGLANTVVHFTIDGSPSPPP